MISRRHFGAHLGVDVRRSLFETATSNSNTTVMKGNCIPSVHFPRCVDSSGSGSLPIRQTQAPSQGSAGVFPGSHVLLDPFLSEHARKPLLVGTRTPQWANVKPPLGPRWFGPR